MQIGIPRERKLREGRVALTPAACAQLIQHGHQVYVEHDAGLLSGYRDQDYSYSGCIIFNENSELYAQSQVIVKVKEPITEDLLHMRSDHLLFCYLHLAAAPDLLARLMQCGLTALAFETLRVDGRLPLLAPMSAIAGRLALQLGMHYLQQPQGGAGVLLGGVLETAPGRVVVVGAGVAGGQAAAAAAALGAEVWVFDRSLAALERIKVEVPDAIVRPADPVELEQCLREADLVIGAVLLPGAAAPRVITQTMLEQLPPGRVVVDISIDQGGCVEGIRATDWQAPAYIEDGHVFVAVTNLPGAVPRTSTQALSQAILPYVEALADGQLDHNPVLQSALALRDGKILAPELKALQAS